MISEGQQSGVDSNMENAVLQGYLAHKNPHPPLGPPKEPWHGPTIGFYGVAVPDKRGTPVWQVVDCRPPARGAKRPASSCACPPRDPQPPTRPPQWTSFRLWLSPFPPGKLRIQSQWTKITPAILKARFTLWSTAECLRCGSVALQSGRPR